MNKDLIDYLEALQDSRKPAHLRFWGDNGGVISFMARTIVLQTEAGEPALLADGAIRIPVARLLSVNDRPVGTIT